MNRYWNIFLEEAYQNHLHEGFAEYYKSLNTKVPEAGITHVQEWNRDSRKLVYLDTAVVTEAFLHHEIRIVDKGACISFHGKRDETKPSLIGFKVEITYDLKFSEIITISHQGFAPFVA